MSEEVRKRGSRATRFFLASCFLAFCFLLPGEPHVPSRTLAFVGDVMLGRGVAQALDGDWEAAFAGVQPWLARADLAFANLESPLTTAPLLPSSPSVGETEGGLYDLRAPPEAVAALRAAGFDVVSLANNHALDAGGVGLAETVATLDAVEIAGVADWSPVYQSTNLPIYRIIAFDDSLTPLDLEAAAGAVASAAERADVVIVSIHWGGEYQAAPGPRQQAVASALAAAGADLIVGHGPHVLQRVEWVGETLVAYSLGNFLFDQPYPADCRWGAILRVTLQGDRIVAVEAIPTVAERGCVVPAGPEDSAAIHNRMRLVDYESTNLRIYEQPGAQTVNLFQSLLLGVLQGATEFLPVSSSGHLVLVPWLLDWPASGLAFDAVVHWGTALAAVAYFWRDWVSLVQAAFRSLYRRTSRSLQIALARGKVWAGGDAFSLESAAQEPLRLPPAQDLVEVPDARLAWLILLGTLPGALAGWLLEDFFEGMFARPVAAAGFLLVTAALLTASERFGRHEHNLDKLVWLDALLIGLAQALAILPGISRSGATIAAGLACGLRREPAARFSFLLATPIILGAGLLKIVGLAQMGGLAAQTPTLVAGFVASSVVGFGCIHFLLRYLQRRRLYPFAVYCAVAGLACLPVALVRGM